MVQERIKRIPSLALLKPDFRDWKRYGKDMAHLSRKKNKLSFCIVARDPTAFKPLYSYTVIESKNTPALYQNTCICNDRTH